MTVAMHGWIMGYIVGIGATRLRGAPRPGKGTGPEPTGWYSP